MSRSTPLWKGDWAEYATTFGLSSWSDGTRPCFACTSTNDDLLNFEGCNPFGLRWRLCSTEDYDNNCDHCEIKVELSQDDHTRARNLLAFDQGQAGGRGRCLVSPIASLGLHTGDRLEPTEELPNPGETFDTAS